MARTGAGVRTCFIRSLIAIFCLLSCACTEKPPPRSKTGHGLPLESSWRAWTPRAKSEGAAQWTFLGPRNLLHDNLYGSPIVAGRVNAVLATGDALYAGADRGGVWKTTDDGGTWLPLTDDLPFPNITALASMDRTIFAGTGHGAILRSEDGGKSWDFTAVPEIGRAHV